MNTQAQLINQDGSVGAPTGANQVCQDCPPCWDPPCRETPIPQCTDSEDAPEVSQNCGKQESGSKNECERCLAIRAHISYLALLSKKACPEYP